MYSLFVFSLIHTTKIIVNHVLTLKIVNLVDQTGAGFELFKKTDSDPTKIPAGSATLGYIGYRNRKYGRMGLDCRTARRARK